MRWPVVSRESGGGCVAGGADCDGVDDDPDGGELLLGSFAA